GGVVAAAGLGVDAEAEPVVDLPGERAVQTLGVVPDVMLPAFVLLVDARNDESEAIANERVIVAKLLPRAARALERQAHAAGILAHVGQHRGGVDQAAGVADAEEDAVGSAAFVVTGDVVAVARVDAFEVVDRLARLDAADANRLHGERGLRLRALVPPDDGVVEIDHLA